jgi:hypothetical protein
MNIGEFINELTETVKRNYPHLVYTDTELGQNEEAARFLLGKDPKHCVHFVRGGDGTFMCICLVLERPVDPALMKIREELETEGLLRFDLTLVSMENTSHFPVVRCVQYRDRRVRAVNILITIDQDDLSMDLVLAILETILIDYLLK